MASARSRERIVTMGVQLNEKPHKNTHTTQHGAIPNAVPSLLGVPEYRQRFLSPRCNEENERANKWLCLYNMQGRGFFNTSLNDVVAAADGILYRTKKF